MTPPSGCHLALLQEKSLVLLGPMKPPLNKIHTNGVHPWTKITELNLKALRLASIQTVYADSISGVNFAWCHLVVEECARKTKFEEKKDQLIQIRATSKGDLINKRPSEHFFWDLILDTPWVLLLSSMQTSHLHCKQKPWLTLAYSMKFGSETDRAERWSPKWKGCNTYPLTTTHSLPLLISQRERRQNMYYHTLGIIGTLLIIDPSDPSCKCPFESLLKRSEVPTWL